MGLYKAVSTLGGENPIRLVALARSYTLYERSGGPWYVNFRVGSKQYRLSTGQRDFDHAKAMVEGMRGLALPEACEVNDKHLYRMIERARYRNRRKGIPVAIGINDLRAIAKRCGGRCEVTGRRLEDSGPFRPSLDRIDPSLGYVPDNVRIVCLITNTAMLHYGESAFAELAIAYCRHHGL